MVVYFFARFFIAVHFLALILSVINSNFITYCLYSTCKWCKCYITKSIAYFEMPGYSSHSYVTPKSITITKKTLLHMYVHKEKLELFLQNWKSFFQSCQMSEHLGNLVGHKAFSTIRTHQNVRNLLVTDVSRNFANSWAAGLLRIGIGCKKNLFLPSFYFRQWRLFQEEKEGGEGWPLCFLD